MDSSNSPSNPANPPLVGPYVVGHNQQFNTLINVQQHGTLPDPNTFNAFPAEAQTAILQMTAAEQRQRHSLETRTNRDIATFNFNHQRNAFIQQIIGMVIGGGLAVIVLFWSLMMLREKQTTAGVIGILVEVGALFGIVAYGRRIVSPKKPEEPKPAESK